MIDICYSMENISYSYHPDKPVISGLSLILPEGRVTAVLGPNGIGKTTFLHLALGWLKPLAGRIELHGKSLAAYSRRELGRQVSIIPQSEHIAFEYSVLEYVLLGRTPYLKPLAMPSGNDLAIAEEALREVGIPELRDKPVTELSGGEAQMMMFARAMTQQSRIILMDEPTSHLDLGNKVRVFDLIHTLTARGVTVILTSHEPDEALAVSDHVVLIGRTGLIFTGAAHEVMTADNLRNVYGVDIRLERVNGHTHFIWYGSGSSER